MSQSDAKHEKEPADSRIEKDASIAYWNSISADDDGMLGGFAHVSRADLRGSSIFLSKLRSSKNQDPSSLYFRVVDCGAGIGRITAGLLSRVAEVVDVVEPVDKFAQEVRRLDASQLGKGRVGDVYVTGLEKWSPTDGLYNLIWCQWCLVHLTDVELEAFFRRCKSGLKSTGWLIVKENIAQGGDIFDEQDSSVTRTQKSYERIFKQSGYKIVATDLQKGFPRDLFAVRIWALQPE